MVKPEKLKLMTENLTDKDKEEINKLFLNISKRFPELLTEVKKDGKLIKTINIDKLKEVVGDYADKDSEVYELTWAGKQKARIIATEPTTNTLRPVIADSEDFENTGNLYIEGDNLEVLKILRKSYSGKIKCIYIDPPYNTRKDFVYKDNFARSKQDEDIDSGTVDDYGNRMKVNNGMDGRYHSNWLNMIYPRLQLAHKLLKKEGVIFISIDDNEVDNLKKVCDEIFGESNFVANMIWQSRTSISNDSEVSLNHNHTLIYSKNISELLFKGENLDPKEYSNPDNDQRGPWKSVPLDANKVGGDTVYPIINPNTGKEFNPPNKRIWAINRETYKKLFDDNRISFGKSGESSPKKKLFLKEREAKGDTKTPSSILIDAGTTQNGTKEIMDLFENKKIFSYPKPVSFIIRLLNYGTNKDDITLDFFSGSGTTAHAVMQLNSEDNGSRKYIMVQLEEKTDEDSEAFKAGYKNICEIGKERIRRAAKKIKENNKDKDLSNVDFGFKVFKLGNSIYKDTLLHPGKITQENLEDFAESIKTGTSEEDVLYSVLLGMGIPLSAKVEIKTIQNKKVFVVADGLLVACFDKNIDLNLIKELAKIETTVKDLKPKFVFKESSIKNDSEMMGIMDYLKSQIFKTTTELKDKVKVI
jgi:adenine-specific DNA-methyltransferase